METISRKRKFSTRFRQRVLADKVWMAAMSDLEQELNRLSTLFAVASFILVKQDFQSLSYLRQNHSALKMKMSAYFREFKPYALRRRQKMARPPAETRSRLENELLDLTCRFQKIKNKLFSASRPCSCL